MNQLCFDPYFSPEKAGSLIQGSRSFTLDLANGYIVGHVEKVVFFNPLTGQCLLDVKVETVKTTIMITGYVSSVYPGQSIYAQLDENIIANPGQVFTGGLIEIGLPNSERNLRKFLKSQAMSELGKTIAHSLVETFPKTLFSVFDFEPERLKEAAGIGNKRQCQILEAWNRFKAITQFKQHLFREGLPLDWADILWAFYKHDSQSLFIENPYKIGRKHNLSFDLIDAYGLRNSFPKNSEERARCALNDYLQNSYKQGHCAYPEKKLLEDLQKKLDCCPDLLANALEIELIEKQFVEDQIGGTPCIYLSEVWRLERNVAEKLLSFRGKEPPWGWFNFEKVLNWAQTLLNIQLAPLQKEAIETALSSSLTVITGGPGTGKTTLVRSLTAILQTQFLKFALCSPTGRAAKRLEETTGHPAQTIHRLLKFNSLTGEFNCNRHNPLDVDLVLVDEISMVDIALMHSLLEALPPHCALILVGDADQIPPVGAGNILQSMIESQLFTLVRLKEIFRQSKESLIKINAHRINCGEMPLKATNTTETDFHYLPVHGIEEAKKTTLELATRTIPNEYGIKDLKQVQILVPLNGGNLGTLRLNQELQNCFADISSTEKIIGFEQNFTKGDKVMVIKNDYKKNLFNGDIGFIRKIDHSNQYLEIEFDDRNIRFSFEELDRLSLAYAISIHKSQGSEYRAVIVVLTNEHLPMAQRHLIYTAVTRGKEHVFLVAEPKALQTAILSDENNKRWQKLSELLKNCVSALSA